MKKPVKKQWNKNKKASFSTNKAKSNKMGIKTVKNLLKTYGLSPSKSLGQNFLIDDNIIRKILNVSNPSKNDLILEIGPGTGRLTLELSKKAKQVIAIEKDEKMCIILKNLGLKNVKIINKDILKVDFDKEIPKNYKVIANIPYYLTSRLIRKLLEGENKPSTITLMIQKEVAKRICDTKEKSNVLSLSVWFYAKPEIQFFVSKNSFYPKPKIDSAVIKIVPHEKKYSKEFNRKFFKIIKAGFSHPRKQLINNFSEKLKKEKKTIKSWLTNNNIPHNQRAEDITLEKWINLTISFNSN